MPGTPVSGSRCSAGAPAHSSSFQRLSPCSCDGPVCTFLPASAAQGKGDACQSRTSSGGGGVPQAAADLISSGAPCRCSGGPASNVNLTPMSSCSSKQWEAWAGGPAAHRRQCGGGAAPPGWLLAGTAVCGAACMQPSSPCPPLSLASRGRAGCREFGCERASLGAAFAVSGESV